jgi:hypothetical protein
MLYAGYKKGALVYRTHKDTLKPEPFEVYSPKALANIRGLEDVLEDRCITVIMKRGRNLNIVNKEIPLESEVWQQIRDMLYVFYLQFYDAVGELSAYNEHSEHMSEALKQRELELWKPILTLALFFEQHGGINDLFKRILEFAKEKAEEKEVENRTETLDFILVQTLDSLIKEDGFYRVKSIKEAMALNFDEPQKWLTTKWIGNALRRLGFTVKRRFGSGYEYYFSREKVTDLMERLGIFETRTLISSLDSSNALSSLGDILTSKCKNAVSSVSGKEEEKEGTPSYKDVQNVHHVHLSEKKKEILNETIKPSSENSESLFLRTSPISSLSSLDSPSSLLPRAVWLCGECAREHNLIVSLSKFGKCEVCGKTDYLGESNISIKPSDSEADAPKLLQCPRCNAQFFSEVDLKAHLRGIHHIED